MVVEAQEGGPLSTRRQNNWRDRHIPLSRPLISAEEKFDRALINREKFRQETSR
jgi:hypothetical protein